VSDGPVTGSFSVAGRVRYGHVPTQTGPIKLNYTGITYRAARRITVEAQDNCGNAVAEAVTDDLGNYSLTVPGYAVKVVPTSRLSATNASSGGSCQGASWNTRIVDNTRSKAVWGYDSGTLHQASNTAFNIDIPLTHNGTSYTSRAAAPFALADTVVSAMERVCQAVPNTAFPALIVNWSPNNRPTSGDKTVGDITTSHFTVESWNGQDFPQLYILGKEGVDTDEYDDHVVAHEFGHYLENSIYRSDTIGGAHGVGDMLDPRVAFGEGYGNAFSGMTFNNSVYVDTYGTRQATGFSINVASAPSSDQDRGIHSEKSVQYMLWSLYNNNTQSFGKVDHILRNYQRSTPALTSLLSFASYYNSVYGGTAQSLQTLWESLNLPYDALCVGTCTIGSAGNTADPFDLDGDIGTRMASTRTYSVTVYTDPPPSPLPTSGVKSAQFWNPYRQLQLGTNAVTDHEVIDAGPNSSYFPNKLGYTRWYHYSHTGSSALVNISLTLGGGRSCAYDFTDLVVYESGTRIAYDWTYGGCPSVQFTGIAGHQYVVVVEGVLDVGGLPISGGGTRSQVGVPSYQMTVQR